jgi:hypothetical protein
MAPAHSAPHYGLNLTTSHEFSDIIPTIDENREEYPPRGKTTASMTVKIHLSGRATSPQFRCADDLTEEQIIAHAMRLLTEDERLRWTVIYAYRTDVETPLVIPNRNAVG